MSTESVVSPRHRAMTPAQEGALRLRLSFLCMSVVAGRQGDMKRCTEKVLDYVSELIEPYSTTGKPAAVPSADRGSS